MTKFTFLNLEIFKEFSHPIKLGNFSKEVYTYSYRSLKRGYYDRKN